MTFLGISVGTTATGVCVLQGDTLLDRQMHTYHYPWSEYKLRIIINLYRKYIVKCNARTIVVKTPPPHRVSKRLTAILKRIMELAKEHGCVVELITRAEIKEYFAMNSQNGIADYAKMLYPELSALYEKGKHNSHNHYKKVFEAVLAAHIYKERARVQAFEGPNTIE